MRKIYLFALIFISIIFFGCESTDVATNEELDTPIVEETEVIEEAVEPEVIPEAEEVIEEYIEEDDVEFIEEEIFPDEEYLRSIENITTEEEISQEEFFEDKLAILQIIDELSEIMEENDVDEWISYLDPDSKKYYSNPANLRKVQRKLPNRLIELKTIKDYFINIFIPARRASKVDEIRYISKTEVNVVEVKEDGSTVVYYYFRKINDKWYVNLPIV